MGMYSETVQCVQCVTVYSVTVYSVTVYSTYCAVTPIDQLLIELETAAGAFCTSLSFNYAVAYSLVNLQHFSMRLINTTYGAKSNPCSPSCRANAANDANVLTLPMLTLQLLLLMLILILLILILLMLMLLILLMLICC